MEIDMNEQPETIQSHDVTDNVDHDESIAHADAFDSHKQISELKEQVRELEESKKMLLADKDNMQKNFFKETARRSDMSVKKVLNQLLSIIDHFHMGMEYASKAESPDAKNIVFGFNMVQQELETLMKSYNVKTFDSLGESFDYNLHHALDTKETTESPAGTVIQVYRPGYMIGNEILRPAQVIVSKAPASQADDAPLEKDDDTTDNENE